MDDFMRVTIRRRLQADHEWARNTWLAAQAETPPPTRVRVAQMLHRIAARLERPTLGHGSLPG